MTLKINTLFLRIAIILVIPLLIISSCGKALVDNDTNNNTPTLTNATFDETKITQESVTIGGATVTRDIVSDQIVIQLASGKTKADLQTLITQYGCSIIGENSLTNTYQVQIPSNKTPQEMRTTLSSSNIIESQSSNLIINSFFYPNDPAYEDNSGLDYWAFSKIKANYVWDLSADIDDSNIKIAVMDTGIDSDHEEFTGRLLAGQNFVAGEQGSTDDDWGHGTSVAGIIGAKGNNSKGIAGMSWNCNFIPIRIMKRIEENNNYKGKGDYFSFANAIAYAVYIKGANIINCSFGIETTDTSIINNFKNLLKFCIEDNKNVLIVTAAGNENKDSGNIYPGALSSNSEVGSIIINVGGTDQNDARWNNADGGSNYGSNIDVAAPAYRIYSTFANTTINPSDYKRLQFGTSLSAPFVTGTAALIKSFDPSLTPLEIKTIIKQTADSINPDHSIGSGRLNAWEAILKTLEILNKSVITVSSNVSGAQVFLSSDGGNNYSDTGKTTSSEGKARVLVNAGNSVNYEIKLTKSGYNTAYSDGSITGINPGVEAVVEINLSSTTTTTTTTTSTTTTSTTTTTLSTIDHDYGPYSYSQTPVDNSLFIPSGSTVYISLLSSGKLGFFCFGWQGYLKINNNLIGYEANYTGSVSGSDWITYYYKGIGDAYYASTSSSYSSSWVKYKNNTSLVDNGYWVDITDLVSLNATNNFTFYHYTDNPIGYKIRIIE